MRPATSELRPGASRSGASHRAALRADDRPGSCIRESLAPSGPRRVGGCASALFGPRAPSDGTKSVRPPGYQVIENFLFDLAKPRYVLNAEFARLFGGRFPEHDLS